MSRRNWSLLIAVLGLIVLLSPVLPAQPKAPSAILNQYRGQRTAWFTAVFPFANSLFGILATIEFAWSAAVMLLEKSDMQSWTSALIRKLMWIGAFYMLLINGRYWIPAITDSFEILGQQASGNGPMSPSDVFTRGIDIAGALMAQSSSAAFFENLGTSLAMIFTGIVTALAFIGVAIQFVVAMVESYVVVAAGLIFLGFGGSRWTAPYVERYIGLGVAIGVKIMLIYLLIGAGMSLSVGLDEPSPSRCLCRKPGDVGTRNHGCIRDLHDAVLADPEALLRCPWWLARVVGRRPRFDGRIRRKRSTG